MSTKPYWIVDNKETSAFRREIVVARFKTMREAQKELERREQETPSRYVIKDTTI